MTEVLTYFLMVCKTKWYMNNVPLSVTRENVNMVVYGPYGLSRTLIDEAAKQGNKEVILELLKLGAAIRDITVIYCHGNLFHWFLHYYVDPNMVKKEFDQFLCPQKEMRLLVEYNSALVQKGNFGGNDWDYIYTIQHVVTLRENKCRKALLTLIWLAPTGLKSLFVFWCKNIWNMKPYTDDLQPSIGPRSSVWDLKESQDLSPDKKQKRNK